jgi:AcrR family transcriptional regulator
MRAKQPLQKRGHARVTQILDAATAEISQVGADGLVMNAIVHRTGMSPGSLYQFFPNKTSLLQEIAKRHVEKLQEITGEVCDRIKSQTGYGLEDLCAELTECYSKYYRDNPSYPEVYGALNTPFHQTTMEDRLEENMIAQISSVLEPIVAPGAAGRLPVVVGVVLDVGHTVLTRMVTADPAAAKVLKAELLTLLVAYLAATLPIVPARAGRRAPA